MSLIVVFFCVNILEKLMPLCVHFRFAIAKQRAPPEQLKTEVVVLVRRATDFVQASVIVGQETDLVTRPPLFQTCANFRKLSYVCCYRYKLQITKTFFLKLNLEKKSAGRRIQ